MLQKLKIKNHDTTKSSQVTCKDTKLTVQGLLAELDQARQKASNLKQLSASVRAIEAKAKISGLLVQKVEIGGPGSFEGYNERDPPTSCGG